MSRGRKPVRARSSGAATHNAGQPGKLQVTIWGETEPDTLGRRRNVAMALDEDAIRLLAANLNRLGFLLEGPR